MTKKTDFYIFDKESENLTMAASLSKRLINIRDQNLKESLSDFEGNEHRMERVKKINDILFINDSRATSTNAVWFALESMNNPTTWIMNISNIDVIDERLLESINEKVKTVVIQGVYNSEIIDFFTGLGKNVSFAMNLEDAVRAAFYSSEPGDTVLFSPGVASMGMYRTYRERGTRFKEAIAQL